MSNTRRDDGTESAPLYTVADILFEVETRRRMRATVRAAILRGYEPAGNRFVTPRVDVYQCVSEVLKRNCEPQSVLARMVRDEVRAMGGRSIRRHTRRLFRGLKLRSLTVAQALRASKELRKDPRGHRALHLLPKPKDARAAKKLAKLWEAKLKADGLAPVDKDGRMPPSAPVDATKAAISAGYFDRGAELRERLAWELRAWDLHVTDGLSERDVAAKLGVSKSAIGDLFVKLRKRALDRGRNIPGHSASVHETSEEGQGRDA